MEEGGVTYMFSNGMQPVRVDEEENLFDLASMSGDSGIADDDVVFSSDEDEASSTPLSSGSSSSKFSLSLLQRNNSEGPFFDLSSLMTHLPIKRGLSNYYKGKSQSFTSLANARCIEDLPKKETVSGRKKKKGKSCNGGLDTNQKQCYAPRASSKIISKKASRGGGSCASLLAWSSGNSLLCNNKPHPVPVHKNI